MKTDHQEIAKDRLVETINSAYGLGMTSITFIPKGEEAYTYVGVTPDDRRYFVRVQATAQAAALQDSYAVVQALQQRPELSQVVAPLVTRQQALVVPFGSFSVAVFPYIEGRTLHQSGASTADILAAATLIAHLHQTRVQLPTLRRETFANPFRAPIMRALAWAEAPPELPTSFQQQVRRLLRGERADILDTLERMATLQGQALTLVTDWVVTHGDPNLDNFLKDPQGAIHLTDWGSVAIGPPERDVSFFAGDMLHVFLSRYTQMRPTLRLHRDVLAFYFYRWTVQEIADYTTRLLFHNRGEIEDEHAWTALQPYLPIRHEDIIQSVNDAVRHM